MNLGILDGVTTNPSLMAKEGIKGEEAVMNHYKTICEMVDGDISAEVISTDFNGYCGRRKKTGCYSSEYCCKSADDQRWCKSH